jgi:hypothetical protein
MKTELLQLATLLIRRAPQQLVQHRKELIKFGWNHLKRDDSAAKYYAFLNVCHFLEAYQAPEKIVLQVRALSTGISLVLFAPAGCSHRAANQGSMSYAHWKRSLLSSA